MLKLNQKNTLIIGVLLTTIVLCIIYSTARVTEGFECPGCGKEPTYCGCSPNDWRIFKKPNYYGFGTWGYHYGEPFYWRHKDA